MKPAIITGIAGIALLALTGCGQSEEEKLLRDMWECSDGESLDECERRVEEEIQASADRMMEDLNDSPMFSQEEEPEGDTTNAPDYGDDVDVQDEGIITERSTLDDLYVDIHTLDSCEDADMIWGGLMNAELEGHEIDGAYLADLEDWMVRSVCW